MLEMPQTVALVPIQGKIRRRTLITLLTVLLKPNSFVDSIRYPSADSVAEKFVGLSEIEDITHLLPDPYETASRLPWHTPIQLILIREEHP